ncbi:MAG: DEAD/DEAH box helicase [bacterium]|nr:DEAD/DEAH box helicase [bacterium]
MTQASSFRNLGIAPNILTILDKLDFKEPTPIQEKSIPSSIEGKDLVGIAQTGTGKTLAFGIPMIQAALNGKNGLVVLPTRELAMQVYQAFNQIGGPLRVRSTVVIGGESIRRQIFSLQRNPSIIIGTPGRIIDLLKQKAISLDKVKILVLDEADRMLDMGFAPQLKQILQMVPKERQTMLFSATMPQDIFRMAQMYMKMPLRVEIARPGTTVDKVTQELFFVEKQDKPRLLEKILYEYRGSVLVFARTKFTVRKIAQNVRAMGHTVGELHSNRSLSQRHDALEGFRNGKYRVLAATDIAARGIDVKGIELVLNFDLPQNSDDYVHRIGRTARAGDTGHAISFATPDQKRDVYSIERLIRATLPISKVTELPPARTSDRIPEENGPHRSFSQRSSNSRSNPRSNTRSNSRSGDSRGFSSRPNSGYGPRKFSGQRRPR